MHLVVICLSINVEHFNLDYFQSLSCTLHFSHTSDHRSLLLSHRPASGRQQLQENQFHMDQRRKAGNQNLFQQTPRSHVTLSADPESVMLVEVAIRLRHRVLAQAQGIDVFGLSSPRDLSTVISRFLKRKPSLQTAQHSDRRRAL